jgi:uncharacterized membrane protein
MNTTKTITSVLFGILFLTAVVSAVVGLSLSTSSLEFKTNNQALDIVITNGADPATIDISTPAIVTDGISTVSFILSDTQFLSVPASGQNTLTVTSSGNPQILNFGDYSSSFTITATNTASQTATKTVNLNTISSFCKDGPVGTDLEISKVDINNNGNGKDDEWEPLDEIEIEVQVENNGNVDVDDVILELGFFDNSGKNNVDDFDFDDTDEEEIELGDINDGKEEEYTFTLIVPPDFEDGNYKLALKAYGDKLGESVECTDFSDDLSNDFYEAISVDRVSDSERFVVVDDIILQEQATCGEAVSGSFTLFNIGDEDQERVLITMKSNELQIDQEFELTKDLDQGDDEDFSFTFVVPDDAVNKLHTLNFRTFYDYNRGSYREQSEETFFGFLNVVGCGVPPGGPTGPTGAGNVLISASLDSDAVAGEELVISATLTNLGTSAATFTVDAKAFQTWAELDSISPRVLNLAPGESRSTTLRFNVDEDVEGSQSFVIETESNGNIDVQEVEVNIKGKENTNSGITGFAGFDLGNNNLIWVIAVVNIILIILIILVAVRISRR